MRMVVTGAAGFIGSHVAEAAAKAGYEVIAVDALDRSTTPEAAKANWAALSECAGITRLELDLAVDDLAKLAEADAIVHLAGRPGVRSSWGTGAARAARDNVTTTRRLLAACRERQPRIVVASSSSVYGSATGRPHREADALRPASPYAVTKVEAERLTAEAVRDGVPAVVLRYFSVYGPRQRPDMAFHRFIEAALERRGLPVLGDGRQTRAFTHVSDVVTATLAAVTTRSARPGSVINVGYPEPIQVRAAIELLAGLLGVRPEVRHLGAAAGDVAHTWADTGEAARLLGWTARVAPAEGLADQIAWHRRARRLGCAR